MPVIGYLGVRSPAADAPFIASFHKGLSEAGFVDGKNVTIEFRSAQNDYGRLPALAAELVQHRVNVIAATSTPAALAAKAATATIPIVFKSGSDPVNIGLVSSLNRPGGNVTGVAQMNITMTPKRLELLHELNSHFKGDGAPGQPSRSDNRCGSIEWCGVGRSEPWIGTARPDCH